MANVTLRGNAYLIRCSAGYDVTGKQIQKSMTWKIPEGMSAKKAEKEAHHQAALFEEAVRNGDVLEGKIKFKDFADRWFADYANVQLRPRTVKRYEEHMVRINNAIGHIQMNKLRPYHLMKFYNELSNPIVENRCIAAIDFKILLKDMKLTKPACSDQCNVSIYVLNQLTKGLDISYDNAEKIAVGLNKKLTDIFEIVTNEHTLADKTIQNYHRLISSILAWAVKWQVIASNPAERVAPPKVQKKEAVYLDEYQTSLMLEKLECEPVQFKTAVYLLLFTGMRRGELLGLKWSDIDFDNATISIQRTTQYLPEKGVYEDETKNASSVRTIKVTDSMIQLLKMHKGKQAEQRLQLCDAWHDEDWIFTKWDGQVMRPDTLTSWFRKFIDKNNLPSIHLHSLRHTNATLLIASGTNLQTVASRLGHANTTTTLKIYSHAIQSADAKAAETLDLILNKKQAIMNK